VVFSFDYTILVWHNSLGQPLFYSLLFAKHWKQTKNMYSNALLLNLTILVFFCWIVFKPSHGNIHNILKFHSYFWEIKPNKINYNHQQRWTNILLLIKICNQRPTKVSMDEFKNFLCSIDNHFGNTLTWLLIMQINLPIILVGVNFNKFWTKLSIYVNCKLSRSKCPNLWC
jgi:hypothetical protein